ncbi:hypothetical protein [Glutamicibacter sp.]|uniref:hypothetical protein n=1 Tax=Glutamicibacter sp. TaxID=1931995 RepID=UPI002FDFC33E
MAILFTRILRIIMVADFLFVAETTTDLDGDERAFALLAFIEKPREQLRQSMKAPEH